MKIKIILACILLGVSGCVPLKDVLNYWPDNPAEEYVEDQIESFTGLDIDLTSEDGQ